MVSYIIPCKSESRSNIYRIGNMIVHFSSFNIVTLFSYDNGIYERVFGGSLIGQYTEYNFCPNNDGTQFFPGSWLCHGYVFHLILLKLKRDRNSVSVQYQTVDLVFDFDVILKETYVPDLKPFRLASTRDRQKFKTPHSKEKCTTR